MHNSHFNLFDLDDGLVNWCIYKAKLINSTDTDAHRHWYQYWCIIRNNLLKFLL